MSDNSQLVDVLSCMHLVDDADEWLLSVEDVDSAILSPNVVKRQVLME